MSHLSNPKLKSQGQVNCSDMLARRYADLTTSRIAGAPLSSRGERRKTLEGEREGRWETCPSPPNLYRLYTPKALQSPLTRPPLLH